MELGEWLISGFTRLSNRHQKVTINGESSPNLPITCGVPQGSNRSPLLFLIYINDMHSSMEVLWNVPLCR